MARLPNKGLALKHDLAGRSTGIVDHFRHQILPEGDLEILCGDPVRIVWRRSECNRKVAENNIEEGLEHDINLESGRTKGCSHLKLGRDVKFEDEYSCYGECGHEIPGVLLAIYQGDIASKKSITHAL